LSKKKPQKKKKPGKRKGRRCNRCGAGLSAQTAHYRVEAKVTSEPTELCFSKEDLEQDHEAEFQRLAGEIAGADAEELEEQVFVALDFFLCVKCKVDFVRGVRRGPR